MNRYAKPGKLLWIAAGLTGCLLLTQTGCQTGMNAKSQYNAKQMERQSANDPALNDTRLGTERMKSLNSRFLGPNEMNGGPGLTSPYGGAGPRMDDGTVNQAGYSTGTTGHGLYMQMNPNDAADLSKRISDAIVGMNQVHSANVLLAGDDAYVGVGQKTDGAAANPQGGVTPVGDVTPEVKDAIAAKVRELAPGVKNVYVSANADFVDRVRTYAEHVKQGHPVQGFMQELGTMVQRLFPSKH
ncbi:YhcN/YlaJ family sporulation lipoprotein [Paenibacillus sp. y28]|uniref:YhcN/YlaJ family sporulation lipoprotein n=1 Tax=Paenibacillus sp. y28 TaxID=3129110 RepID=UPI00301791F5